MKNKMNGDSSVFATLESSLSEIDTILGNKNVSIFEALESSFSELDNILGTNVSIFTALENTIDSGIKALGLEENFTLAAFESFLDESIENLEEANEGFFSKKNKEPEAHDNHSEKELLSAAISHLKEKGIEFTNSEELKESVGKKVSQIEGLVVKPKTIDGVNIWVAYPENSDKFIDFMYHTTKKALISKKFKGGSMTRQQCVKILESKKTASESFILENLLQTANSTIETKCKSVEDCDKMLDVIATEATKFNSCMESMASAGKELKSGTITKEQFKQNILPAINELKTNCASLGISDSANESSVSISDEDISTMREFIVGTRNLLNEKKLSFGGSVDASLEGFISSCESMTIAEEGVNLQTGKLIRSEDVKTARKNIKEARKLAKKRTAESLEKAVELLEEAKSLVNKTKTQIHAMPEAIGTWEKIKAAFTPIFTLLPKDEVKSVKPKLGRNYDGSVTLDIEIEREAVEDELSKATSSGLKKKLQEILNLVIKKIDADLTSYKNELSRVSSPKATESIDSLLFELSLESYNDDDDMDDMDDDDLDETSFDCYLK